MKMMLLMVVLLGVGGSVAQAAIEIGLETDKTTYSVNEDIVFTISAYNSGTEAVTIGIANMFPVTYIIDEDYDWAVGRNTLPAYSDATIQPGETLTWNLTHGEDEWIDYALSIGTHSVIGELYTPDLGEQRYSEAVSFEIVPEPATLLVFGGTLGVPLLRKRSLRNS